MKKIMEDITAIMKIITAIMKTIMAIMEDTVRDTTAAGMAA